VRGAIAPVVYRAKRCSTQDVSAIAYLANLLYGGDGTRPAGTPPTASPLAKMVKAPLPSILPSRAFGPMDDSRALFYQVAFAEFWGASAPTADAAQGELVGLSTATALTLDVARRATMWPSAWTKRDPLHGKLVDYKKPLLMLQGALDPATPAKYSAVLRDHFTAAHQTYALFPAGAHDPASGTVNESTGKSCALFLYASFLEDPTRELDTSCVSNTQPVTFVSKSYEAKGIFGMLDAWE
jgi:pimeloyl-ACP methyl ester carboxylesterase